MVQGPAAIGAEPKKGWVHCFAQRCAGGGGSVVDAELWCAVVHGGVSGVSRAPCRRDGEAPGSLCCGGRPRRDHPALPGGVRHRQQGITAPTLSAPSRTG